MTQADVEALFARVGAKYHAGEWLAPCPLYADNHREGADPYKVVLSPADRRPGLLLFCRVCGRQGLGPILDAWGLRSGDLATPLDAAARALWDAGGGVAPTFAPEDLDRAYTALLTALALSDGHRRWLRLRGFPDAAIDYFGYRSAPPRGGSIRLGVGDVARTVPGVERRGDGVQHRLRPDSLLLPCKDADGRVFGIKQRLTDGGRARIRLLSSRPWGGPAAVTGVHHAGLAAEPTRAIVTEGERKADLAAWAYRDAVVLAAPGTGRVDALHAALAPHRHLPVFTAFDRDPAGEAAERAFEAVGWAMGYRLARLRWAAGKGIDDAIAKGVAVTAEPTPPPAKASLAPLGAERAAASLLAGGEQARAEVERHLSSAAVSRLIREGRVRMRKVAGVGQVLSLPEVQ